MPSRLYRFAKSWDEVELHLHGLQKFKPPWTDVAAAASGKYPADAFSLGQSISKVVLMQSIVQAAIELEKRGDIPDARSYPQDIFGSGDIAWLGVWIGLAVHMLRMDLRGPGPLPRIYGIDKDPEVVALSDEYNRLMVENDWAYKGIVADCDLLNSSSMMFETSGELIRTRPGTLINTSCEHMSDNWFETADGNQLIIMQTNDNPDLTGHINTVDSEKAMFDKYPLADRLYSSTLITPEYTRYTQIGYKDGRN